MIDLFPIDDIGWHQIDHVPDRPEEAFIFQAVLIDFEAASFLPRVGNTVFFIAYHFCCQYHAGLPDFGDMRVVI